MANRKDFYIGRKFDPSTKTLTSEAIQYDPSDLTTHMFVTGMTGSGKTGLCISIMEEAALQKIPAIIIDPKGDLTNLLLHFPQFLPSDFEPWIDPEAAKREGKSTLQMAEETAANWKKGLTDWGIGAEELAELSTNIDFSIYTPGSTSGIPVNILSSFKAPEISWEENQENLREQISSNITALLGLIGFTDIDPLSSREHILLANIMEHFWSQGINFDLTDLILQTQSPPFERLGAFPIEKLFPERDRLALAMRLNNFLASPSFQTWLQGQSLDIQQIYFSPNGKPRHSIFYLAHLSENERMFFVTLLYGAVESWMRKQTGTSGLRALVYFDEILGYLPPIGNPPSHSVMLRMLKQARAFGVGLILSSQNPVDLDYKALSNAGTWMIGRLQTDQDKERLMDGLQNASGSVDRQVANQLLSSLGKRIFLLHNIHEKGLTIFNTRWAMNYLAGPLTRNQIPALNKLVGVVNGKPTTLPVKPVPQEQTQVFTTQGAVPTVTPMSASKKPIVPSGIDEFYLPNNLTLENAARNQQIQLGPDAKVERIEYHPTLISQAEVRYLDRRYGLQMAIKKAAIVEDSDGRMIRWDDFISQPVADKDLGRSELPQSVYRDLPMWLSDVRNFKSLQTDFMDWIYRSASIKVKANQTFKIYAGPETSEADFQKMCDDAANELLDGELDKIKDVYDKKMDLLEDKLEKEMRDVETAENKLEKRRLEEVGTHGELLLSFLSKRKKSISSSLSKRRMTSEAKSSLAEEKIEVEIAQKNLDKMEVEMTEKIAEVESLYKEKVHDVTEIPITPMKKDIFLETFGIGWMPYYRVKTGDRTYEIPAYQS
ncbi:MAG: DUF87 domain-containing protein [Anaerolineaceae bacterium]|nr:DUF87 domain-containing protein [Anaerolineaceae bacterium]